MEQKAKGKNNTLCKYKSETKTKPLGIKLKKLNRRSPRFFSNQISKRNFYNLTVSILDYKNNSLQRKTSKYVK